MINIVVAMTRQGIIGKGNALPWHIPEELQYFKQVTRNGAVIMGLRTFQSIGKPLPHRHNIVLGPPDLTIPGVDVCHSIDRALECAQSKNREIFIIGGADTYRQFLPIATRLYISFIKKDYAGDVIFPAIDWNMWKATKKTNYADFEAFVYEQKRSTSSTF